jgi:hypothetical protein
MILRKSAPSDAALTMDKKLSFVTISRMAFLTNSSSSESSRSSSSFVAVDILFNLIYFQLKMNVVESCLWYSSMHV